ncbi:hypothetical protein K1T71_003744 [Dendrolimus kikuchii]|uniref:Uncharacterized protein n=1 Tax=Dendrolimus kikuchii TaxID=765133 RepID=A0ACC1D8Z6_9NEOP|nr:hypothetical protein K1T71_003744 [Dendrolimus kikuchii]
MQALEVLKISSLSETVLKSLSQNRISTLFDFLDEEITKLSAITKLDISQVLAIRNEIFAKFSAPLANGSSLLVKSIIHKNKLNTGIQSLDTILDGGFPTGYITEICGLADSGKTQLCLQISINCVKQSDSNVLYVDTKGDFSAIRIQKMLDAYGCSPKEMALIMFKIKVVHIWTMEELIDFFKHLKKETIAVEKLSMIIIDSLPCLMFQHLGDDSKIGLTFLNTFVNYARYLCKELNVGVICVNIQTRWVDMDAADLDDEADTTDREHLYIEKKSRCLGKYWSHIPALVIKLDKVHDSNSSDTEQCSKVDVMVVKSNSLTNFNLKCILNICDLGVT